MSRRGGVVEDVLGIDAGVRAKTGDGRAGNSVNGSSDVSTDCDDDIASTRAEGDVGLGDDGNVKDSRA